MALGIAAIPVGMIVDGRLAIKPARRPPVRHGKSPARRAAPAARRRSPRKPARPKR